ncbi:hypothetical protein CEXT_83661 [Caerostris extrusa]|uniref:Uncharacterized protein n=1 Tax=Caerostris extrusa TaxID=172846 RepID=A0AAV4RC70_CAEEX|nr:hypothetical protein CEXT_83661 [Caerostris extrusa]
MWELMSVFFSRHNSGVAAPDQGRGRPSAQGGQLRARHGVRRSAPTNPALKVGWLFRLDGPSPTLAPGRTSSGGNTLVFKRLTRLQRARLQVLRRQLIKGKGIQSELCLEHQPSEYSVCFHL